MRAVATVIFWTCSALLFYLYVGYPLLVRLLAARFGIPVARGTALPTITVIVTAYNEEKSILAKLHNLAQLDYPESRLNVVVASTDRPTERKSWSRASTHKG